MAARHDMVRWVQEGNGGLGHPQYGPNLRSRETRVCYVPGCGRRTLPSRYTCQMHKPTVSDLPASFPAVITDFEKALREQFPPAAIYTSPSE